MKTTSPILYLLMCSIILLSCAEERENDLEVDIEESVFEFDNLKVGDVMTFTFLRGVHYPDQNPEAIYTEDTLELTVVDEVDGNFIVQEHITENSAVFDSDIQYIYGDIEKNHELKWKILDDSIIISALESQSPFESHIFPFAYKYTLTHFTENQVDFEGCHTTIPYHESYGNFFIKNGELLGTSYPHLNGYINYAPMALDGDGSTHIYNKEEGFVRVTTTSGWTADVRGWDRIN